MNLPRLQFAPILFALLWLSPAAVQAQDKALDCSGCHDSQKKLSVSTHASLTCETCHDQVKAYPHPKDMAKPECSTCHPDQQARHERSAHAIAAKNGNGAAPDCGSCHGAAHEMHKATTEEFRKAVPDTCGLCHSDVTEQFKGSVHGKAVANGIQAAPICTDCHGEHSIMGKNQAGSPVSKANIRDTCGRCHGDVRLAARFGLPTDRLTSFDASFHGLAGKGGSQTVANCASCHGFHNVLASNDAKSMTHPDNLPATCGQCHPGAGKRFALGTVHWLEGGKEPQPVAWVRLFYWGIIPLTLGLMFLHHFGDWVRKLMALRFRNGAPARVDKRVAGELRMYPLERIQHALLAVSFIILGWSGFALKYPDSWWCKPLLTWEATVPIRGIIHRAAALVFVGCSVFHFVTLITSRTLREHWLTMIPKLRDIREGMAQMAYNLGLRKTKPHVSSHSYIEKVEYWAVVWGAVVMGISGFLLWFNGRAMQVLPKVWLDVATAIHFYEALLACLAIIIWHLYTVIFDPDVYPMDTAWLTGRTVRKREPHAHAGDAKEAGESRVEG